MRNVPVTWRSARLGVQENPIPTMMMKNSTIQFGSRLNAAIAQFPRS